MSGSVLCVFGALSAVALCAYGIDKRRAKKHRFRISEAFLLGVGFCGGAAGALLGMNLFRHKTRHWYFWTVNGVGLAWQLLLLAWMRQKGL